MKLIPLPMLIVLREAQLLKVYSSILFNLFGMLLKFMLLQPEKVDSPILETLSGI